MSTRTLAKPSRAYDHLYDPLHTLGSEKDHAKANLQARAQSDKLVRVPVFSNIYSELVHHPRFEIRLQSVDPIPQHVSRQWPGYRQQAIDALERYQAINFIPGVRIPTRHFETVDVIGKYRAQYFKRPLIPFLQNLAPEWVLSGASHDVMSFTVDVGREEKVATPFTKVAQTQTDYRDSETQTDPYSPQFVIKPGEQPELLTLASLSWGRGLPAGLAEVEMIERARAKRIWESKLPPISDPSQWEKRRRMMDAMELREWSLREDEIEKLQQARLSVLVQLLQRRERNNQQLDVKRLQRLWSNKQLENSKFKTNLQHEYIRCLRKLTAERSNIENKLQRRDIVREYSDPGSQTFAPLTRIGFFMDKNSERHVVRSHFISTYEGLLELESWLPISSLKPRVKAPRPNSNTADGYLRRKYRLAQMLNDTYENIQTAKKPVSATEKPLRFLERVEKPPPRPATPSVKMPDLNEEKVEMAIICLQQFLRGRSIQNMVLESVRLRLDMVNEFRSTLGLLSVEEEFGLAVAQMYEGKEKRLELIQELRSTHALQRAGKEQKQLERKRTMDMQKQKKFDEHKAALVDQTLSEMEADVLADMLDYLSKELVRLQEERRIHAFAMLAERQRRIREAEETGRRQVEQRRRREEDEMFKQVLKIHQNTVDDYLTHVLTSTIGRTADEQARREVEQQAQKINDIAYELEEKRDQLMSEEIVADLVHNFLLPEVKKQTLRQKVKREQRKLLLAAHKEIFDSSKKAAEGNSAVSEYPDYLKDVMDKDI